MAHYLKDVKEENDIFFTLDTLNIMKKKEFEKWMPKTQKVSSKGVIKESISHAEELIYESIFNSKPSHAHEALFDTLYLLKIMVFLAGSMKNLLELLEKESFSPLFEKTSSNEEAKKRKRSSSTDDTTSNEKKKKSKRSSSTDDTTSNEKQKKKRGHPALMPPLQIK